MCCHCCCWRCAYVRTCVHVRVRVCSCPLLLVLGISVVREHDLEKDTKQRPTLPPTPDNEDQEPDHDNKILRVNVMTNELWETAKASTSLQDVASAKHKAHNTKINYRDSLTQKYHDRIVRLAEIYGNRSPPVQNAQAACVSL